MARRLFLILFLVFSFAGYAQLRPGFDKEEYLEMMRISICSVRDSAYASDFEKPKTHRMLYQSGNIGLENSWDLWTDDKGTAVISLRGTTRSAESWLENFYAAMVPAKGTLQLDKNTTFNYQLAENPEAAVHVGWLVGMAFLAREIVPKIEQLYQNNTKDFLIMGHSQGGGIAYLLTAYLYQLQRQHLLPEDIRFKTYCSAGPKPGNLYFAYEYEALTQNGWAYNVVNPLDWVPETPFSVQTLNDFNVTNPFKDAKKAIRKEKFPRNVALGYAFSRMDNPSRKAQRNYEKFLGKMTSKLVAKYLKDLKVPDYAPTANYVRTGAMIVLPVDEAYQKQFPSNDKNVFLHHVHKPYIILASKLSFP
ncbi:lipase family protein [Flavobacterium humi]|uniref:Lipase family protein n=1 Tax=Flavobacterium humi TaxID=2562683 RepID=A0A4Z0L572_9FLAO|nr:lipase family protein [Flavobacterium humi]TGD56712.1 lipase family protein [Flavobacterium humi]